MSDKEATTGVRIPRAKVAKGRGRSSEQLRDIAKKVARLVATDEERDRVGSEDPDSGEGTIGSSASGDGVGGGCDSTKDPSPMSSTPHRKAVAKSASESSLDETCPSRRRRSSRFLNRNMSQSKLDTNTIRRGKSSRAKSVVESLPDNELKAKTMDPRASPRMGAEGALGIKFDTVDAGILRRGSRKKGRPDLPWASVYPDSEGRILTVNLGESGFTKIPVSKNMCFDDVRVAVLRKMEQRKQAPTSPGANVTQPHVSPVRNRANRPRNGPDLRLIAVDVNYAEIDLDCPVADTAYEFLEAMPEEAFTENIETVDTFRNQVFTTQLLVENLAKEPLSECPAHLRMDPHRVFHAPGGPSGSCREIFVGQAKQNVQMLVCTLAVVVRALRNGAREVPFADAGQAVTLVHPLLASTFMALAVAVQDPGKDRKRGEELYHGLLGNVVELLRLTTRFFDGEIDTRKNALRNAQSLDTTEMWNAQLESLSCAVAHQITESLLFYNELVQYGTGGLVGLDALEPQPHTLPARFISLCLKDREYEYINFVDCARYAIAYLKGDITDLSTAMASNSTSSIAGALPGSSPNANQSSC